MIDINEINFKEEIKSKKVVIVDFWAKWCQPCNALSPILEEISNELEEIKFCKIDIDENKKLANEHNIKSIPCMIIFKEGKEINRIIGFSHKKELETTIKKMI
ncbi:MAG TPA: thioredoxin [Candidatus Nanoarchaeia archaeon]|nr:thioredoxin [Candidatus Nanoarchaeia archaeon]